MGLGGRRRAGTQATFISPSRRQTTVSHLCPPQLQGTLLPTLQGPSLQILQVIMLSLPSELSPPRGQGRSGTHCTSRVRSWARSRSQAKVLARSTFPHSPAHLSRRRSGPCALWRIERATAEITPLVYPSDRGFCAQTLFRGGYWDPSYPLRLKKLSR